MPAGRPPNPIKKIVNEINEVEKFLRASLDHNDPRTMAGMQTRQAEMTDKIRNMKLQYKAALKERGFAIFLIGDQRNQNLFAQIAAEFDCYVLSANIMYEMLSKKIWASVRPNDSFSAEHVLMIDDQLHDVRTQLGISSMPHPSISADMVRPINTLENLVVLVKASIESVLDSELAAFYIEDVATTRAVEDRYTGTVFPLLLTGADNQQVMDFQKRIFKGPDGSVKTFVISVGPDGLTAECRVPEVNEETVISALVQGAQKFGFKIGKPKTAKVETETNDNSDTTEEK